MAINYETDTISAIATPFGTGAIGIIRISGNKAFEICEQLQWEAPDKVLVGVGDGTILSGMWRGFQDFNKLGIIDKMPQMVAVQAEGSSAITKAWFNGGQLEPVAANTIADSISVNVPRDGFLALQALKESGGSAVTVSDAEIIAAIPELARASSVFAEPGGAAVYAGLKKMVAQGAVKKDETVAIVIGGNGLKDIDAAAKSIQISQNLVKPDLEEIIKMGLLPKED